MGEDAFIFLTGSFVFCLILVLPVWTLVVVRDISRRLRELEKHSGAAPEMFAPVQSEPALKPFEPVRPESAPEPVAAVEAAPAPVVLDAEPEPAPEPEPEPAPVAPEPELPPKWVTEIDRRMDTLESRTSEVAARIWSWFIVGEEYRRAAVTREYAVATTWLIRMGVVILLCGIAFFLKYSIDHNWLGPEARVSLMVLAGLAMAGFGVWKSRGSYRNFFVALAGAGFVTLYLSGMAAFRLYHLVEAVPAFGFMAAVTAAAMTSALGMNALLPALLGCVGGFLTPVAIETGSHDLAGFFLYLTILIAGTLFTAYRRDWLLLQLTSFVCYAALGGSAVSQLLGEEQNLPLLLLLLSLDFLLYGAIAFGTARRRDATILELLLLVGNAAFYFLAGIPAAELFGAAWKLPAALPLFAAVAAMAQMLLLRRRAARPVFQMFLAAETAFSLALVVPLLLSGVWITAAWSVLALLFLGMAQRSRSRTLLVMAILLYFAIGLRAFFVRDGFDPALAYGTALTERLLGLGTYIASLAAATWMLCRNPPEGWALPHAAGDGWRFASALWFGIAAGALFLGYSSFELTCCMRAYLPVFDAGVRVLWWSLLLAVAALLCGRHPRGAWWVPALLLALMAGVQIGLAEVPAITGEHGCGGRLLFLLLTRGVYVLALTLGGFELWKKRENGLPWRNGALIGFIAAGGLFFLFTSQELYAALAHYLPGFRNGGVTVWWSLCAFAMLFGGIGWRIKALRLSAAGLFAVCAVKVFFMDLAHLEPVWRIAAFAALGVVMLIAAVLYIRFRERFFLEPEKEEK